MGPDLSILELRSRVLAAVRGFFLGEGFLEVETPVRLPAPPPEPHIEPEPSGDWYLRTSPELHMKRLLAAGCRRIFQLGPCFRRGERGRHHAPEFTMLEWYRADAGYDAMLGDVRALLPRVAAAATGRAWIERGGRRIDLAGEWRVRTVAEACRAFAGWDPVREWDADRFDLDMVARVEPALEREGLPAVLRDFPAPRAALARLKPGDPAVAERWEIYVGGLELVNAFSELTDAGEQRLRFEAWRAWRRAAGRTVAALDEPFLAALPRMPPSGGAALGIDRLVMLLAGSEELADVRPFTDP